LRGWCWRWGWHSRLSYPTPRRPGEVHHHRSHHLRRGLAWRTAVRAFLRAPPPWGSQAGPATCFLYTPLYLVLQSPSAWTADITLCTSACDENFHVPVSSANFGTIPLRRKCRQSLLFQPLAFSNFEYLQSNFKLKFFTKGRIYAG
jgi:hypothetical protein